VHEGLLVKMGEKGNASAGVKTNLLFFTKGTPTARIWYYDLSDVKVGKKTLLTVSIFEEFFRLLPPTGQLPAALLPKAFKGEL
jgi:hypothetical protein